MFTPFADAVIIVALINVLLAWSFYLPIATGKLFAGQVGFMAMGAYIATGVTVGWGLPFVLGAALAVLASTPVSAIIAALALRLSGFALAITSLGFALVLQVVLRNAEWAGATFGIRGIEIQTTVPVAFFVVLGVGVLLGVLERSRHGLAATALRCDATAAAASAIPIRGYQIAATVLGCAIASLAGALYAHFIGFVQPDLFNFALVIGMASWVFFGGTTTFVGPAFGALSLSVLPQVISSLYQYRLLAYALLVIVVVLIRPNGLITRLGLASLLRRLRPRRSAAPPLDSTTLESPARVEV